MFKKEPAHRAWLATIVEELAEPLGEMSYDEIAAEYLNRVDVNDHLGRRSRRQCAGGVLEESRL